MSDDNKPRSTYEDERPIQLPFDAKGQPLIHADYKDNQDSKDLCLPDCQECGGSGFIMVDTDGPPEVVVCSNVAAMDRARNVNKGWSNLMKAESIPRSPLVGLERSNLLITADFPTFRKNLRHVALRMPTLWLFRVVTDLQILEAWFASAKVKGVALLDPDLQASVRLDALDSSDLTLPPDLLIIQLGVKTTSNKEMPKLLFEVIQARFSEDKPTWLWDQPHRPFRDGHRAYMYATEEYFEVWGLRKVNLGGSSYNVTRQPEARPGDEFDYPELSIPGPPPRRPAPKRPAKKPTLKIKKSKERR